MKVAIKLPAFLQPRTNRHEDLAPDTGAATILRNELNAGRL